MGIKGLQSFLKINQKLLSDRIELTKTDLVIDSKHLMKRLFAQFALDKSSREFRNDIYNGNLVAWAQAVRQFFKNLEECKITPVLIVEGSLMIDKEGLQDLMDIKKSVRFKRALEIYRNFEKLNESSALERDTLFFATNFELVFRTIIKELAIKIIQCPFEANKQIARLANELDCPVLSHNTDFICYDIRRGFILWETFNHKQPIKDGSGQFCLRGRLFSQAKMFAIMPGLSKENIPLFSVLLKNAEFVVFRNFIISTWNQSYGDRLKTPTFDHKRIVKLLEWLRDHSQQEATDCILEFARPEQREKLECSIRMFLEKFDIEKEDDDLMKELGRVLPFKDSIERLPAHYLRSLFESDVLTNSALDMIFKNDQYNHLLLEDDSLPTSNLPTFRPISVALALLRPNPYLTLTPEQRKIQSREDQFCVFDQYVRYYGRRMIRPLERLENFGSLEPLDCYSMISLDSTSKKELLMDAFRFSLLEMNRMTETLALVFLEPARSEATICFMLVKYVARETQSRLSSRFVNALLLTHLYYAAFNGQLNRKSIPVDRGLEQFLLGLGLHAERNNGLQYQYEAPVYKRIIHMIGQLSVAYKSFAFMNVLLNDVFPQVRLDKWFNGTLIFRLTKLEKFSRNLMHDLCENSDVLFEASELIKEQVLCEK